MKHRYCPYCGKEATGPETVCSCCGLPLHHLEPKTVRRKYKPAALTEHFSESVSIENMALHMPAPRKRKHRWPIALLCTVLILSLISSCICAYAFFVPVDSIKLLGQGVDTLLSNKSSEFSFSLSSTNTDRNGLALKQTNQNLDCNIKFLNESTDNEAQFAFSCAGSYTVRYEDVTKIVPFDLYLRLNAQQANYVYMIGDTQKKNSVLTRKNDLYYNLFLTVEMLTSKKARTGWYDSIRNMITGNPPQGDPEIFQAVVPKQDGGRIFSVEINFNALLDYLLDGVNYYTVRDICKDYMSDKLAITQQQDVLLYSLLMATQKKVNYTADFLRVEPSATHLNISLFGELNSCFGTIMIYTQPEKCKTAISEILNDTQVSKFSSIEPFAGLRKNLDSNTLWIPQEIKIDYCMQVLNRNHLSKLAPPQGE